MQLWGLCEFAEFSTKQNPPEAASILLKWVVFALMLLLPPLVYNVPELACLVLVSAYKAVKVMLKQLGGDRSQKTLKSVKENADIYNLHVLNNHLRGVSALLLLPIKHAEVPHCLQRR